MAIPNDRIVEYSNSAASKESYSTTSTAETLESGYSVGVSSYTDYRIDSTIGKLLSGTGSVSITENQAMNGWTSMFHPKTTWDLMTNDDWENEDTCWSGELAISSSGLVLRDDSATIQFLYVKNTGEEQVKLALEGDEYDILIPAGASVSMRVNNISAANIKVIRDSADSTIEYIIAK